MLRRLRSRFLNTDTENSCMALPVLDLNGSVAASEAASALLGQLQDQIDWQLKLLVSSIKLNAAVLLLPVNQVGDYQVYSHYSHIPLVRQRCFQATGIFACLKSQDFVSLSPYRSNAPAVPCLKDRSAIGAVAAARLDLFASASHGMLCISRGEQASWSAADLDMFRCACGQIRNLIKMVRDTLHMEGERILYQQAFEGVRRLNATLSLGDIYRAAAEAVNQVLPTDFFMIGSLDKEELRVDFHMTQDGSIILPERIGTEGTLVRQAVKYRYSFPEMGQYHGTIPVLAGVRALSSYRFIWVVPCIREDRTVTDILIVGIRNGYCLTEQQRELIELIAGQLSVKIGLGRSHDRINLMVLADQLTGIANLRAFDRAFNSMYERALRRESDFSLIMCDIDLFKQVNDNYGHPCGDLVIQTVARHLHEEVRSVDLAARTGGEEFRILLEDAGKERALEVAERIRQRISAVPVRWQQHSIPVTISLGVATFPHDGRVKDMLLSRADQALYEAKKRGRNRSCLWRGV